MEEVFQAGAAVVVLADAGRLIKVVVRVGLMAYDAFRVIFVSWLIGWGMSASSPGGEALELVD